MLAPVAVIGLTDGSVERPAAEVINLRMIQGRDRNRMLWGNEFLDQRGGSAADLFPDKVAVLPAEEEPAVQCGQTQECGFPFGVAQALQGRNALRIVHGYGAHKDRISAVILWSSKAELSRFASSADA